jgi:hypothetical protein
MPGVGGITVLKRNLNGELHLVQQFRIDQRAGIADVEGMIGANSVAVSPDGKYTYVSSGGYYRDHNLLVFARSSETGNLTLLQNIDVYNTSASRVLPSTLVVSPDGKHVYVVGDNFAISTSVILVYTVGGDGTLSQTQEAGPFRSTLLTSATFDPSGRFLYSTASLGKFLVEPSLSPPLPPSYSPLFQPATCPCKPPPSYSFPSLPPSSLPPSSHRQQPRLDLPNGARRPTHHRHRPRPPSLPPFLRTSRPSPSPPRLLLFLSRPRTPGPRLTAAGERGKR